MGKVVVINWLSLDGVMQAPGAADEDTRDDFTDGGWAAPYADGAVGAAMGAHMGDGHVWLFGHRTYRQLLSSWTLRGGPFKDALTDTHKFVASRDPSARLDWPRSTLLSGNVVASVSELRAASPAPMVIMGSGVLIGSLMAADLIDEYLLLIAPVVLGAGRRLFAPQARAALSLVASSSSDTGVLMATYRPARASLPHGGDA